MTEKPKIIAVVGPTTSGKTSLAIDIAQKYHGEIISVDSRQVYRGLDIGTGKVTAAEMQDIPHHLLDIVEPTEIYTAEAFVRDAAKAIADITGKQHTPIIAGGTFFYIDILRGKMQAAPVEPNQPFRESLEKYSNEELFELLQTEDPKRAATIDSHNRRRLVRALEIIHTLGRVPEPVAYESFYEWLLIGVDVDKNTLQENFRLRLDDWLERCLLQEVSSIRERLSQERFLELGFEYTLVAEYLDEKIDKKELYEKFIQKNWQYAKRQMTWLKRDEEIEWFVPENREAIFGRVSAFLNE